MDLSVLMYTNESYLPIASLFTKEFNKFSNGLEIKKYVCSNTFNYPHELDFQDFVKLDSSTELSSDSRQFSKVMLDGLKQIDSEYVLFMLDDFFLITEIKVDILNSLIDVMTESKIDHLSLMSYGHSWNKLSIDYSKFNLPNDIILEVPMSYCYMFSLQPSIWKRESLIEIFTHNPNISVHEYDSSNIRNKKGERRSGDDGHGYINTPDNFWDYGFTHYCLNRTFETALYTFDDRPLEGDYFLFLYSGAMRFGKFDFNTHNNTKLYIVKYLEENNITKDHPVFGKYF